MNQTKPGVKPVGPGRTTPAGENTSNEEMARQVARQTSSDRMAEKIFRAERDGARSDVEAAKAQRLRS